MYLALEVSGARIPLEITERKSPFDELWCLLRAGTPNTTKGARIIADRESLHWMSCHDMRRPESAWGEATADDEGYCRNTVMGVTIFLLEELEAAI